MKNFLVVFLVLLSFAFSLAQEVVGSKKIVIEESVVSFVPPYTYEYCLGPNLSPYTMTKGMFNINFVMYSEGGVLSKIYVGLWDFFTLGVIEDIQGIVGNSSVSFSIPIAAIKLNILNEVNGFSLSIAFDQFSYGISGTAFNPDYYTKSLYGIHIPMSIRYKSFFNYYSDFVFGVKFPLLPVGDVSFANTSVFSSTYVKFSEFFMVSFGIDNLFISSERITNSSIFAEAKFSPVRSFSVSMILNYSFVPLFERMVKVEYVGSLF
ncbi:MAG: hypothetical protein ACK4F9_07265 [Brevinematia bacterium]